MERKKKETQDFLVTSIVIVVVVIGFIGGFVMAGDLKERVYRANDNKDTSTESGSIVIAGGGEGKKTLGFDEKYVESDQLLDYEITFGTYAGSTNAFFTVNYGEKKNELKITKYNYDNAESQEYTMEFGGNVVDVFQGIFNDDPQYNALLYLLDNGDVCYSLIENMVQNNQYGYYTTIESLSKIAKFYRGNACDPETGMCKSTTFAQAIDGKIYDLNSYIK